MLKTWAKETTNLEFYSEVEDKTIPTVDLGIPNTERGNLYSYIVYSFFFSFLNQSICSIRLNETILLSPQN